MSNRRHLPFGNWQSPWQDPQYPGTHHDHYSNWDYRPPYANHRYSNDFNGWQQDQPYNPNFYNHNNYMNNNGWHDPRPRPVPHEVRFQAQRNPLKRSRNDIRYRRVERKPGDLPHKRIRPTPPASKVDVTVEKALNAATPPSSSQSASAQSSSVQAKDDGNLRSLQSPPSSSSSKSDDVQYIGAKSSEISSSVTLDATDAANTPAQTVSSNNAAARGEIPPSRHPIESGQAATTSTSSPRPSIPAARIPPSARSPTSTPFPVFSTYTLKDSWSGPYSVRIDMFCELERMSEENIPAIAKQMELFSLSEQIAQFFRENRQPSRLLRMKIDVWKTINQRFEEVDIHCRTHVFGSSLSGFGARSSDMDLCLFTGHFLRFGPDSPNQYKKNSIETLQIARNVLEDRWGNFYNMKVIEANIPVLKLREYSSGLEVDISCNAVHGVKNTHLLYCYSLMDWRVRPLVLAIKSWAKRHGINDASQMTLSSYALTLLVINYLQCMVQPPVLPSAQKMFPYIFDPCVGGHDLFSLPFIKPLPKFRSENTQSLGSLFVGFFSCFCDFDFSRDACSVREGRVLSIAECQAHAKRHGSVPRQWDANISVEEPFERTNAARAVVQRAPFDRILAAFNKTNSYLASIREPSLETVFAI